MLWHFFPCAIRDGGDCCGWSCRKNQAGGITFPDNNYCGMNGYDCKTQDNCFSKDIKVYRFQITGEVNDAGNEEEIQVFVNSGLFWPKAANQCADNRDGVRRFLTMIFIQLCRCLGDFDMHTRCLHSLAVILLHLTNP